MACSGGYMGHMYSRETNRCVRCQAWRPGFAPKKQYTKPRAECQVCEREQACESDGTLGHHGYRRPGWGFITDDCRGQGYKPFPAYDALVMWLKELDAAERRLLKSKADIESGKVESFVYTYKWGSRYSTKQTEHVTVAKGAAGYYRKDHYRNIPSFDEMKRTALVQIESSLHQLPAERTRVEARIRKAKAMTK